MTEMKDILLSPQGRARRDAMLVELLDRMGRLHRRRRLRSVSVAMSFAILATVCLFFVVNHRSAAPSESIVKHRTDPAPAAHESVARPAALIEIVRTESTILDRYQAQSTGLVRRLSDEELVQLLAEIGRPAGLIRTAGSVRLTVNVVGGAGPVEHEDSFILETDALPMLAMR